MLKYTKYLFVIGILFLCAFSFHKYFFAFAEMEYKKEEKIIETTLLFTAHDLEISLKKKNIISTEFEKVSHDKNQLIKLENEILNYFYLENEGDKITFELLDFELTKTGLINLYLTAKNVELQKEFKVTFTNLMSDFPNQQNKLTFIYNKQKSSAVFLKNKPTQTINL